MPEPAVHVALIAWRRPTYTRRTVESFLEHNDPAEFRLCYGLDGGYDHALPGLLDQFDFEPLVVQTEQVGIARMHEAMAAAVSQVAEDPADLLIMLENDWECVRPIPIRAIRSLLKSRQKDPIRACWLHGPWKERGKRNRTCTRHLGSPQRPPMLWTAGHQRGEFVLIGRGYWGHTPSAARVKFVRQVTACGRPGQDKAPAEHRFWSGALGCNVAWLQDPVFYHFGVRSYKTTGGKRC